MASELHKGFQGREKRDAELGCWPERQVKKPRHSSVSLLVLTADRDDLMLNFRSGKEIRLSVKCVCMGAAVAPS